MLVLFRKRLGLCAFVAGAMVLAAAAPDAGAGFTAVRQSTRKAEVSHEQILERVYGGNFVADATGLNFSNDSGVTVTRLEDSGTGSAGDELWSGRVVAARAVAAFGRKARTASYFGGTSAARTTKIVEATGTGFDVAGSAQAPATVDGTLYFGRGRKANRTFSSVAGANRDGMDHLVTYAVRTPADQSDAATTYLLCWEDKLAKRSDRDYNDMVMEMRTTSSAAAAAAALSEPLLIPLPAAVWSGLAGLLGVGAIGAFRKARRYAGL